MAISIYKDDSLNKNWISYFFDGDSGQLDPCFAAFKRIEKICDSEDSNEITNDLELADKVSVKIDLLRINKNHFDYMRELYKDKDPNLIIEKLELTYLSENYRLNGDIEFINQISPKMLTIEGDIWTVENIKALSLINWANVDLQFRFVVNSNIYLWFVNTPIQHFDFKSGQRLTFEWESIKLFIEKYEFEKDEDEKKGIDNVKLFRTDTGSFLFIPLDTIFYISCSGFKEIFKENDINKQLSDLGAEYQFKDNGLIIPMRYSNRIFFELCDSELDYLNQNKDINKIFKEKHIELKIGNLYRLLEINKLLPDNFSNINFKYIDYCSTEIADYSISEIMDSLDWNDLKFIEIYKSYILSPDEFHFWWKMLCSKKSRFNLYSIFLKFNLLSECLTLLSLCSGCPELKFVSLKYLRTDAENEHEIIEQAERDFRQRFGFIWNVIISKIK